MDMPGNDDLGLVYSDDEDEQTDVMSTQMACGEVENLPNFNMFEECDLGESFMDGQQSLSDFSDAQRSPGKAQDEKVTWTEQVQLIHLRRCIDELAENVKEKDYEVAKTRAELKECTTRLEHLERQWKLINNDCEQAARESNVPAEDRLRSQLQTMEQDIKNEEKLLAQTRQNLSTAEYELAGTQVEQGKMLLAEDELKKRETKLQQQKQALTQDRQKKEKIYAQNAVKQREASHRLYESAIREKKQEQEQFNEEKQGRAKASKYLQKTISKLRERSAVEEAREDAHVQQRMHTMLALKHDIRANRDNLRALDNREKAQAQVQARAEEQRRRKITDIGGDPDDEVLRRLALERYTQEKLAFDVRQRENEVEIAERLLKEERVMAQKKRLQPQLFATEKSEAEKIVAPHPRPKVRLLDSDHRVDKGHGEPKVDASKFQQLADSDSDSDSTAAPLIAASSHERSNLVSQTNIGGGGDSDVEEGAGRVGRDFAQPEFEGLWDNHKPYKVPKDVESGPKLPGASKMDREVMERVLHKQREGIIIEQVAGGKKFTGCAFYSKPKVIHFKDFEVGKMYKKKVTLTNVSYTVNYLKLTGITEHLMDFIDVLFDPPGQMSAGLTCEMLVTFKPMINEDLVGEVNFMAQTGPFSVELRCSTKKCDLRVDTNKLEFGVSVVGETLRRSAILSNNGALPTRFTFYKVTAAKNQTCSTTSTSLGRLTSVGTIRNLSPDSEEKVKDAKVKVTKSAGDQGEKKADEKAEAEGTEKAAGEEKAEEREKLKTEDADDRRSSGPRIVADDLEELMSLDGMSVGNCVSEGEIGAFASMRLEVVWQPSIPGRTDTDFVLSFLDPASPNIGISALASAIDVPVWVDKENVDLKICMYDRLYQDTLIINNRGTTALRLKFEVCKELKNHMELLPKTCYIQAQSSFSAQLKFLPRSSLAEDAAKYFDRETGVLEAPMVIMVADQTRLVPFTVFAVVTNSDLEFDVSSIDFGHCSIYESVVMTVHLKNRSILSQQFGFVGIPDYVDVQPNDGFGTVLPLESIDLEIIFKPKEAKVFHFDLTMKSIINSEFKISCTGIGVFPPLELSDQIVHLKATALSDVTTTCIQVINNHTSMNQFSHAVPRIGKGDIAPVGPTSFEFVVPEGSPVSVAPSVGTVEPGQKVNVTLWYSPFLEENEIRKEAVHLVTRQQEVAAEEEFRQIQLKQQHDEALAASKQKLKQKNRKSLVVSQGKRKPPAKGKQSPKGRGKLGEKESTTTLKGPRTVNPPTEESITKDSDAYSGAQSSLMRQFVPRFQTVRIRCHVASGRCSKPRDLPHSPHNTLSLDVHCPSVRPELLIISNSGRLFTDFGNVSIGLTVTRSITVQNIAHYPIILHSSHLNTSGPFSMLNALREVPPQGSHTMLLRFIPQHGEVFQESFELFAPKSMLHLTLRGGGVNPVVALSIKENVFDMGGVLAGEYRDVTFKIANTSSLDVHYCIKLDSQSLLRHSKAQALPPFITMEVGDNDTRYRGGSGCKSHAGHEVKTLVGVQNTKGTQVFDCVPPEGIIPAGGEVEVTLTFAPDHASAHFSDGVRIDLFGQEEQHVFKVFGEAKAHIMYMGGGDPLTPPIESLAAVPPHEQEEDSKPAPIPVLVNLRSVTKETGFSTASTEIHVGCVRTMAVNQKKEAKGGKKIKNGEFAFDNIAPLTQLGFSIEPQKGMIEAGSKKTVTFTWTPPPGFDPNHPLEASINCTLKGDVTEIYKVLLRGYSVSE